MVAPRFFTPSLMRSTVRAVAPRIHTPLSKPFSIYHHLRRTGPRRLREGWTTNASLSPRRTIAFSLNRNGFRRWKSSGPAFDPTPHLGSPKESLSLSQRLKKLSKEYGWAAVGVYLALSALDFPFCFLAVRLLGTDRIGRWEHAVIDAFWTLIRIPFPDLGREEQLAIEGATDSVETVIEVDSHKSPEDAATIGTQLALAYAVHKSLIFFRVPLTAAVTPKIIKVLRSWGWNVGKKVPKSTKG